MDLLKGQLDRIQQQLGGLNASQKMLTGSLVAIMVMTLLWWGRYASESEMQSVLPQSLSSADVDRIQRHFKASGIPSKVSGDQVLVPIDRRDEALASLAVAELMPDNFVSGFDEISKQLNPWDPQSKTEALFKEGKQKTLQNVLRRFPGVKDAVVLIEPVGARRIGASNQATASVHITMRDGGQGNRKLAESAATLVAGAQQHLTTKNTNVVIGQKPYRISGEDGFGDFDGLSDAVATHERYYETKLQDMFNFIEGVVVKVSVEVNNETTETQAKTVDPNIPQKETETETVTETEPLPGAPASEPGALPNVGASIAPVAAAPGGGERSREETRTKFENFPSTTTEMKRKPAGDYSVVSATVRVPRSHFLRAYKMMNGSAAEPTSMDALQTIVQAESERIRQDVIGCTSIENADKVMVSMYDDAPLPTHVAAAAAAPTGGLSLALGSYGKEIAIGLLAVVSLFMVSMMVRKATPAPVIAQAESPREAPPLDAGMTLAGVVGEGDSMLDGMELDEDAVRTQQMLDQVSTLVGENPEAAANLVKRWLNRT